MAGLPERGTQRRRFTHFRTLYAGAEDIGLELHQEVVGDRAAVHAQRLQAGVGVGLHGVQHVTGLEGDGFQRGADDVVAVGATGQAEDGAAGIRIPVRGARPVKAGTT